MFSCFSLLDSHLASDIVICIHFKSRIKASHVFLSFMSGQVFHFQIKDTNTPDLMWKPQDCLALLARPLSDLNGTQTGMSVRFLPFFPS